MSNKPSPAKVSKAKKPAKKKLEASKLKETITKKAVAKATPEPESEPTSAPIETAAPVPAKVATPTRSSVPRPARSIEKLPYNFRTRSLARAIVDAVEDPDAKKQVRKDLKELRSFSDIKKVAIDLAGDEQFDSLLAVWFDAGELQD